MLQSVSLLKEYDEHGRIKRKKKKYHDGESGSEYEFEYDALGNLIGKKKIKEGKESKKHRIKSLCRWTGQFLHFYWSNVSVTG